MNRNLRTGLEMVRGLAFLLVFWGIGSLLHWVGVPLPGNVLGMMGLAAGLFSGIVKIEWVASAAALLLRYLVLWFVPVIVGTMTVYRQVLQHLMPIAGGIVIGSIAVIWVTGWMVERMAPPGMGMGGEGS